MSEISDLLDEHSHANNDVFAMAKIGRKPGFHRDITGERHGLLMAVRFIASGKKGAIWEWRCTCGNYRKAAATYVKAGKIRSCGCLRLKRTWRGDFAKFLGEADPADLKWAADLLARGLRKTG